MDLTHDPALPAVSVIIPCHDEERGIGPVVERCRQMLANRTFEVIVVDDGSTDGTAEAARSAGARVVSLDGNQGKGRALEAGVREARFPMIVFLDGDGQDDPFDLPGLLEAFQPDVDLVIGSRFLGTLHAGSIHPLNRLANRAFSAAISVLFRRWITDSQAGFRVLRREAFIGLGIRAREYDVETDMLLKAVKAGWRVVEVPVNRHPRVGSTTGFRRIRHGLMILGTILRERLTP
jgi:glycosyltransferase involved in cell wall biosynthesis